MDTYQKYEHFNKRECVNNRGCCLYYIFLSWTGYLGVVLNRDAKSVQKKGYFHLRMIKFTPLIQQPMVVNREPIRCSGVGQ